MKTMGESRPRWSPQVKLAVSLLVLALLIYLLARFTVAIGPLILAMILAYILTPAVNYLVRRFKLGRGMATLLTYLAFLAATVAILFLILTPLARQMSYLNLDYQRFINQLDALFAYQLVIGGQVVFDGASLAQQLAGILNGVIEPIFGRTLSLAVDVISSLVWVIFILVVSFYLIRDGPALRRWAEGLVPADYRQDFARLLELINGIWGAFFRGQLLLAMVVSVIFSIAGLALGLPFALAMGVLAGMLEFLPSVGHGIWLVTASILALAEGSTWMPVPNWLFALIIIALHIVFQQFDLNYLIPRIIGRRVHLPPVVVILGIVAGAAIAGVLGIVLAAPTIASGRVLFRYIYANLLDLDPFAEVLYAPLPPPDPGWWRLASRSRSAPNNRLSRKQESEHQTGSARESQSEP